jgi:aspartate carbamoyltransferase catalytic subunit
LLTRYEGVKQIFVAPKELQVPQDVISMLEECSVDFEVSTNLKDAVKKSDAVYMTRIQDE